MREFHKIKFSNRYYKQFSEANIYITETLKQKLTNTASKSDKYENEYQRLINGFSGGKHLFEILKEIYGEKKKVVLTEGKTRIEGLSIFVNYFDYSKSDQSEFLAVYRERGLRKARKFIKTHLAKDIEIPGELVSRKTAEKVINELPKIALLLSNKARNNLVHNVAHFLRESEIDFSKISSEALREINASYTQAQFKQRLDELQKRLKKSYSETSGPHSWQKWIYDSVWLFGSRYLDPIPKGQVGFRSFPDFLFPTVDGFLDIIEIKLPSEEILKQDLSHPGAYSFSLKVSEAIGQVVNYIHQMEINQLQLTKYLKLSTVKPRAIILIGRTNAWGSEKLEALRKLNHSLHTIEIISYDQLYNRGKRLIDLYDKK